MDEPRVIDSVSAVSEVLSNHGAHPPSAPLSLGSGSTAALRNRMARFTGGGEHRDRRAAVQQVIVGLDIGGVANTAWEVTNQFLRSDASGRVDGVWLASTVPSLTLLQHLAMPATMEAVRDIGDMAAAIGRGEPASAQTDASVERLLRQASAFFEPDAVVSILYQNHDASRAYTLTHLQAAGTGDSRVMAVVSTARTAAVPLLIEGSHVAVDESLHLDLRAADLEFGAGIHACPGRELAEAICDGVLKALREARWQADLDSLRTNADGIPQELLLCHPADGAE